MQTLLGLLSHDNSDIALAVVDLLQELTDVETVSESEEEVEGLVDSLLKEQVCCSVCVHYSETSIIIMHTLYGGLKRWCRHSYMCI